MGVKPSVADPEINLVYMGEKIESLRSLVQRYSRYMYISATGTISSASNIVCVQTQIPRIPVAPGYSITGMHQATGIVSGTTKRYNFVGWTYYTFFSSAFLGLRGGVTHCIRPLENGNNTPISISRLNAGESDRTLRLGVRTELSGASAAALNYRTAFVISNNGASVSGSAISHPSVNAGVVADCPMYSRYKFVEADASNRLAPITYNIVNGDAIMITQLSEGQNNTRYSDFEIYTKGSVDFQFVFYYCAPTLVYYNTTPVAA